MQSVAVTADGRAVSCSWSQRKDDLPRLAFCMGQLHPQNLKRNDRGRVGLQHFAASLGHDKTLRANVPELISVWIMLDQACEFAKTQIIGHNDGQRQRLKAAFSGPRCGDYHGTLFFMLRYGAIQKNARGKGPVEM